MAGSSKVCLVSRDQLSCLRGPTNAIAYSEDHNGGRVIFSEVQLMVKTSKFIYYRLVQRNLCSWGVLLVPAKSLNILGVHHAHWSTMVPVYHS